jgi:tRNA pseudouridine38-40 synthase
MTRWKLTLEYDGTSFCGWQRQTNGLSVQQALEEAIEKFSGEKITLHCAGRTDAGVHARAQVAHGDIEKETSAGTVRDAVNFYLRPHRVAVLKVESVPNDFHARFSATSRSYRYRIVSRRPPLALLADHAWHVMKPLALAPMQEAAALLIGKHDFSTFRAQYCQANTPVKTLDALEVSAEDETLIIAASARSFLYHQVRNMVGTLVMVGTGQWSVEDFKTAFAARDRSKGGPTAPAHGLYFWEAIYL